MLSFNSPNTEMTRVVLVDMENKLVAYTGTFEGGVQDAVSVWGHAYWSGMTGRWALCVCSSFADRIMVHVITCWVRTSKLRNFLCYTKRTLPFSVTQIQGLDAVNWHHSGHLYRRGALDGITNVKGIQS